MITSLYLLWPHCLGGYGNVTFTCFETEFKCCKISDNPKDLCILQEVGCVLTKPTTCLKGVTQWYGQNKLPLCRRSIWTSIRKLIQLPLWTIFHLLMSNFYPCNCWLIYLLYCTVSVSITDVPFLATLTCHASSTCSASIACTTMVRNFGLFVYETCCGHYFCVPPIGVKISEVIHNFNLKPWFLLCFLRHFRLRLQGLRQSFWHERHWQVNSVYFRPIWL